MTDIVEAVEVEKKELVKEDVAKSDLIIEDEEQKEETQEMSSVKLEDSIIPEAPKTENRMELLIDQDKPPSHYNDDVYRDRHCDDDELRYQMIQRPIEPNADAHLFNYCDENLETRYRSVIKENKILPLETMKKTIKLKLKKHSDKTREEIKQVIHDTFQTYYPEKILTFIDSTVQILFLERIRDMEREFACVHKGTYYHIKMNCEYHKVRFGRSFHLVNIDIVTSKFE